jgi:hypothetical protein
MQDEVKAVDVANIAAAILVLMNSLSRIGWVLVIQNLPNGPERWLVELFGHVADLVRAGSVALATRIVDILFTIFTKKQDELAEEASGDGADDAGGLGVTV